MFNNSNNSEVVGKLGKCIIVYDDFTKPIAISLAKGVSDSLSCPMWNKKEFEAQSVQLSNQNFLIILNRDIIKERFQNPSISTEVVSPGVLKKVEGKEMAIYNDPDADETSFANVTEMEWLKFLTYLVLPLVLPSPYYVIKDGKLGKALIATMTFWSKKKRIQFKLLFDAVNKLINDKTIVNFVNG